MINGERPDENVVSLRGILLGALMSVVVGYLFAAGEVVNHSAPMTNDFSAPGALFLFFLLAAGLNTLLRLWRPKLAFTRGELITAFVMMLVAAAVPTRGFAGFLMPIATSAQYYATPENEWAELVWPHLPRWLAPEDGYAVRHYYEGLPKDMPTLLAIPWRAWAIPLLCWMWAFMAVTLCMVAVPVILRKQWMETEKIVYPMAQVPLALVGDREHPDTTGPRFLRSGLMWTGFLLSALLVINNGLSSYFPFFQRLRLLTYIPLFNRAVLLRLHVAPTTIGFAYFIRQDVSLGLWLFYLIIAFQVGMIKVLGLPEPPKLGIWSYHSVGCLQGTGALIVFACYGLYISRRHLMNVLRVALYGAEDDAEDAREAISYRGAVIALLIGSILLAMWLRMAGLPLWACFLLLILFAMIFTVMTRVVVETGMPIAMTPVLASDFLAVFAGSENLGRSGLVTLGLTHAWHSEMRCFVMASAATGLRLGSEVESRRRGPLFWSMIAAATLSFAAALAVMLYFPYRDGGMNLNGFNFNWAANYPWRDATGRMNKPVWPTAAHFTYLGMGGGIMSFLLLARRLMPRWPLHPISFIICFHWSAAVTWMSVFVAWCIKGLVLKLGGPRLFVKLRPFFLGLILGEAVIAGLWTVVDLITGKKGNMCTWFF